MWITSSVYFHPAANEVYWRRMTNVIELRTHPTRQQEPSPAGDRAAVVADLVALAGGIREVTEKAVELSDASLLQIERAAQHLVDALQMLEAAANVLTDDGEWTPF